MIIQCIRHAEAIKGTPEIPDDHRYLTDRGRRRFRRIARRLARGGELPDLVVASPAVRAVQTAEILCRELGRRVTVVTSPLLREVTTEGFASLVASIDPHRRLAIVGHEPGLSTLVSTLTGCEIPSIPKGGVVTIESVSEDLRQWRLVGTITRGEWSPPGERRGGLAGCGPPGDRWWEGGTEEKEGEMTVDGDDLRRIRGIGEILSVRLREAGIDSFEGIVRAGEEGLKQIKGIVPAAIPSILEQASLLASTAGGDVATTPEALLEEVRTLIGRVAERTRAAMGENVPPEKARKLEKGFARILGMLDRFPSKGGKRAARGCRILEKVKKRLSNLDESADWRRVRKKVKKCRNSLKRISR